MGLNAIALKEGVCAITDVCMQESQGMHTEQAGSMEQQSQPMLMHPSASMDSASHPGSDVAQQSPVAPGGALTALLTHPGPTQQSPLRRLGRPPRVQPTFPVTQKVPTRVVLDLCRASQDEISRVGH